MIPYTNPYPKPNYAQQATDTQSAIKRALLRLSQAVPEADLGIDPGNPQEATTGAPSGLSGARAVGDLGVEPAVAAIMEAIKSQESGGNYEAVNPDSGAFGAYQFMPDTWRSAAQGAGVNPEDKSPDAQDKAAAWLMTQYYEQFNHDPAAVAQAWYGGPGSVGKNVGGGYGGKYPTTYEYAESIKRKLGIAGG